MSIIKPFSAFKFFIENKRKGLMIFVVLVLSICAISLITVMINSIYESYNDTFLASFTKYSLVQNNSAGLYLKQSIVDNLQSDKDIERLVPCYIESTGTNFSIGGGATIGFFANKPDVNYFLAKLGNNVKQGRLPNNKTNEIAVHWRVMSNKNWEIGQVVGNDKDPQEMLSGSYKIVGVLDGPNVTFVGAQTNREKQYIKEGVDVTKPIAYAVFPKPGKLDSINSRIDKINESDAYVNTYSKMKLFNDQGFESIDTTLLIVILVFTVILSISVSSLMYLIYLQRSDEFGILLAMGYRKSFIYRLILKEVLSLNIISWGIGLLFSYLLVQLLNILIYNPQGSILNFFSPNVFQNTIYIPVVSLLFCVLPIFSKMRKQDPITIIERRD